MKLYGKTVIKKSHIEGRSWKDRRSGKERREAYNLDYFGTGGRERRKQEDRRHRQNDRRKKWVMTEALCSVPADL